MAINFNKGIIRNKPVVLGRSTKILGAVFMVIGAIGLIAAFPDGIAISLIIAGLGVLLLVIGKKEASEYDALLRLQNFLTGEPRDKLYIKREPLMAAAKEELEASLDCMLSLNATLGEALRPDAFFDTREAIRDLFDRVNALEEYICPKNPAASGMKGEFEEGLDGDTLDFLERYYDDIDTKASDLITENGRQSRYRKFYESLQPYYEIMDDKSIEFVESKRNMFK